MISEGTAAPGFELPALVDGERRRVALEDYLGVDVVILAFYPADFNPACDEESCDLDELDLFTMQKDVSILGISPDSVYSHQAFADAYDLNVPLLSDTDHEVARKYDIDFVDEIGQQLIERSVVVVDHDGVVQYAWSTPDLEQLPIVEELKDAIADTGGDDTAFARYRIGHAHYTEGRRSFTAAMKKFGNSEWMMAQNDFQQARAEFDEAEDHFDTAVRFVDDPTYTSIYDDSRTKANSLWQAADWLSQSASEYSSGNGAEGQELREDAERPLETARGYMDPPDPDDWPPEVDDLEKEIERSSILPTEDEDEAATLDVDLDDEVQSDGRQDGTDGTEDGADRSAPADESGSPPADSSVQSDEPSMATDPAEQSTDAAPTDETVDDDEIEAIQAELSENNPAEEPSTEDVMEEPTSMVDEPPDTAASGENASVTGPPAQEANASNEPGAGDPDETTINEAEETVDDDELEAIQAELAANNPDEEPSAEEVMEESTSMVDEPPDTADESSPEAADESTDAAEDAEQGEER